MGALREVSHSTVRPARALLSYTAWSVPVDAAVLLNDQNDAVYLSRRQSKRDSVQPGCVCRSQSRPIPCRVVLQWSCAPVPGALTTGSSPVAPLPPPVRDSDIALPGHSTPRGAAHHVVARRTFLALPGWKVASTHVRWCCNICLKHPLRPSPAAAALASFTQQGKASATGPITQLPTAPLPTPIRIHTASGRQRSVALPWCACHQ